MQKNRDFKNISTGEIQEAVVEMVKKLGIAGSVAGSYDIYRAIQDEHAKAQKKRFS